MPQNFFASVYQYCQKTMRLGVLIAIMGTHMGLPTISYAQAGIQELEAMRDASKRNDVNTLMRVLPKLSGHTLEPLAWYWAYKPQLSIASPITLRQALDRIPQTYWEDRLRNDWLHQLADTQDWATFDREWPLFRMRDDKSLQCYAWLRQAQLDPSKTQTLAQQVQETWLTLRTPDRGCATAAKAFYQSGALEANAIWQRVRQGVDIKNLNMATQAVAILNRDWVMDVENIYRNPSPYANHKLTAFREKTKELVTLAFIRWADIDAEAASQTLDDFRWKAQLSTDEKAWAWGALGRRAAQNLKPEALHYFLQGQASLMPADHLAWFARAALRQHDWKSTLVAIEAMKPEQRQDSTWLYWQGVALAATGQQGQAQSLWQSIASTRGFYEQLATEALGQHLTAPPPPTPLTTQERMAASQNPGLQRAIEAIQSGMRSEGNREWQYTTSLHKPGGMNDRELLAAAEWACAKQIWDRCINTSERTKTFIDLATRFPMPHYERVLSKSQRIGIDPAYVYGLIRQESRFITEARSGVGASGLMQVMPATAKWTARKMGMTDYQPHQLQDPDVNVYLGTAYLKLALDDFEGAMPLAAAAYNAGPSRSRAWRNGPKLMAEIWAENIPFDETRDYVKKVLANTVNYAFLIQKTPQSLKTRLGMVGPRQGTAPVQTDLP